MPDNNRSGETLPSRRTQGNVALHFVNAKC